MGKPAAERILPRLITDANGCWIWPGATYGNGYGAVGLTKSDGKWGTRLTHRAVYEHFHGLIPEGLVLDHLCRVRLCCNPDHLEPVTMRENNMRAETIAAVNARKTHCPRGHELAGDNLYVAPGHKGPNRDCLTCRRQRMRDRRAAVKVTR